MKKIACALLFTLLVSTSGISQSPISTDDVPEAALLTERGQELAKRLHYLRRSESNMGAKHPSLPSVRIEIKKVKEQLDAWAPGSSEKTHTSSGDKRRVKPFLQMNDHDLRQVVLQMAKQIQQLEARIQRLEKLQVH